MINAFDIMHPEDKKALQMLQKIPFVDTICRKIMQYGYERMFRGQNIATMLKVSDRYIHTVYNLMKMTASKIGIPVPEVYVYNDPVMNAFTYGETNTFVCISNACIDKLTDEELMCLMAHECGHILCKHSLYKSVVDTLEEIGDRIGFLSYSISGPIILALQYWARKSELSADRCAAVVSGEKVFQQTMLKMISGMAEIGDDIYHLVAQAREYHAHENKTLWDKIQQNCQMAFYSHPQMVNRAYEIDRWKKSYQYRSIRNSIAV